MSAWSSTAGYDVPLSGRSGGRTEKPCVGERTDKISIQCRMIREPVVSGRCRLRWVRATRSPSRLAIELRLTFWRQRSALRLAAQPIGERRDEKYVDRL